MARQAETADQLRHDIDSGRTGDKVPHEDPAAAPLGTDDEAAGRAPSESARAAAAADERKGESSHEAPAVSDEDGRPNLSSSAPRWVWPLLAVLAIAAVATLIGALVSL